MDTIIAGGGGEQPKTYEDADAVTVTNLGNQKPFMSSSPPPSLSISSSSVSSLSARISSSEPVTDSLNPSYRRISRSNAEEEEEEEFDWVAVEREADVITDKAPEIDEVEEAFSALQLMFNDDDDKSEDQVSESEFVDWIEPPLQLCSTRLLQPYMLDRFYDAFHLFQTDPSVQRMVMSLASDRAVWDAVMNNEVVRELITNGKTYLSKWNVVGSTQLLCEEFSLIYNAAERSEEDFGSAANCIRRLLQRSAIKIMDAVERVTKYVTDLFNGDETVVLATGAAPVMEKLQMTVLLAIVVLLIVFVTRATRAR